MSSSALANWDGKLTPQKPPAGPTPYSSGGAVQNAIASSSTLEYTPSSAPSSSSLKRRDMSAVSSIQKTRVETRPYGYLDASVKDMGQRRLSRRSSDISTDQPSPSMYKSNGLAHQDNTNPTPGPSKPKTFDYHPSAQVWDRNHHSSLHTATPLHTSTNGDSHPSASHSSPVHSSPKSTAKRPQKPLQRSTVRWLDKAARTKANKAHVDASRSPVENVHIPPVGSGYVPAAAFHRSPPSFEATSPPPDSMISTYTDASRPLSSPMDFEVQDFEERFPGLSGKRHTPPLSPTNIPPAQMRAPTLQEWKTSANDFHVSPKTSESAGINMGIDVDAALERRTTQARAIVEDEMDVRDVDSMLQDNTADEEEMDQTDELQYRPPSTTADDNDAHPYPPSSVLESTVEESRQSPPPSAIPRGRSSPQKAHKPKAARNIAVSDSEGHQTDDDIVFLGMRHASLQPIASTSRASSPILGLDDSLFTPPPQPPPRTLKKVKTLRREVHVELPTLSRELKAEYISLSALRKGKGKAREMPRMAPHVFDDVGAAMNSALANNATLGTYEPAPRPRKHKEPKHDARPRPRKKLPSPFLPSPSAPRKRERPVAPKPRPAHLVDEEVLEIDWSERFEQEQCEALVHSRHIAPLRKRPRLPPSDEAPVPERCRSLPEEPVSIYVDESPKARRIRTAPGREPIVIDVDDSDDSIPLASKVPAKKLPVPPRPRPRAGARMPSPSPHPSHVTRISLTDADADGETDDADCEVVDTTEPPDNTEPPHAAEAPHTTEPPPPQYEMLTDSIFHYVDFSANAHVPETHVGLKHSAERTPFLSGMDDAQFDGAVLGGAGTGPGQFASSAHSSTDALFEPSRSASQNSPFPYDAPQGPSLPFDTGLQGDVPTSIDPSLLGGTESMVMPRMDSPPPSPSRSALKAPSKRARSPSARTQPKTVTVKRRRRSPTSDGVTSDTEYVDRPDADDAPYRPSAAVRRGPRRSGKTESWKLALELEKPKPKESKSKRDSPGKPMKIGRPPPSARKLVKSSLAEQSVYCHQCRRPVGMRRSMICEQCTKHLCEGCVLSRYPQMTFDEDADDWTCPRCLDECNCTACCGKRGETYISEKAAGGWRAAHGYPPLVQLPSASGVGRGRKVLRAPSPSPTETTPPPDEFNATNITFLEGVTTSDAAPPNYWATVYGMHGERLGMALEGDLDAQLAAQLANFRRKAPSQASVLSTPPPRPKRRAKKRRVFVGDPQVHWRLDLSDIREVSGSPAKRRPGRPKRQTMAIHPVTRPITYVGSLDAIYKYEALCENAKARKAAREDAHRDEKEEQTELSSPPSPTETTLSEVSSDEVDWQAEWPGQVNNLDEKPVLQEGEVGLATVNLQAADVERAISRAFDSLKAYSSSPGGISE